MLTVHQIQINISVLSFYLKVFREVLGLYFVV